MYQVDKMNRIKLENDEVILEKLKQLNIIAKTKDIGCLSQLIYKSFDDRGNVISKHCKVLSYNWKDTQKDCLNNIYENLTIQVEGETFDINVEYLKDMQKKSWGTAKDLGEI